MKVIYKSIEVMIRQAIYAADIANRTIEKIELSVAEANEILEVFRKSFCLPTPRLFPYAAVDTGKEIGQLYGVRLVVA